MIDSFIKKYLIILLTKFILQVLMDFIFADICSLFFQSNLEFETVLHIYLNYFVYILNTIVSIFVTIDLIRQDLKSIVIPCLTILFPLAGLSLFGLLLINNKTNLNNG